MNKITKKCLALAFGGASMLVSWGTAQAHHSFAMYDTSNAVSLTGIVLRSNPDAFHYQLFIAQLNEDRTKVIRDDKNEPLVWVVELEGAGQVASEGVTATTFPAGTMVSIGFYPLRNGQAGGTRNEFGLYRCAEGQTPGVGEMCDAKGELFGEGDLPTVEAAVTP